MKLGKARLLTLVLLLAAMSIAVATAFLATEGSPEYNVSLIFVIVLFCAGLRAAFLWGRCPNCGKRLFVNLLRATRCPKCGKPLDNDGRYQMKK